MALPDPGWPIALLVALAGVVALAFALLQRRRGAPRTSPPGDARRDDLDTLAAWQPQATRLLTESERAAHRLLARAFPHHLVFAQVPVARFLRVPTRHSYREWLRRVGGQCADLVLCDANTQVLAVVCVRPGRAQSERAQRRQARLARVLASAQIPLHLWVEGALPSVEGARRQIDVSPLGAEDELQPALVEADADGGSPAGLVPAGRAARSDPRSGVLGPLGVPQPDEVTELREPPASTWFDDLDSRGAPLDETPRPPDPR